MKNPVGVVFFMGRVDLDDGVSCLDPSFNRGKLSLVRFPGKTDQIADLNVISIFSTV